MTQNKKNKVSDKHHQSGHRQRLKQRFMENGKAALADYELLEMLLFYSHAQRDTKPIAKELIKEFGNLSGVFGATPEKLKTVDGVGERTIQLLKLVEALAQHVGQSKIMNRDIFSSWEDLKNYCRSTMAERDIEEFRVIFLNRKNAIIADEKLSEGTIDHTPVYPREILRKAIMHNASGIVIAHNHPSGDPKPSQADIDMTNQIKKICGGLGIVLHDHLVIGRGEVVSFKSLNLL